MLEIEQRRISRNSKGHNFIYGGQIQAHNISRRSELISGSSREIQMVITFHMEVLFRRLIYRDARNWTTETLGKLKWSKVLTRMSNSGESYMKTLEIDQWKLSKYSNGHNFSHGGTIQAHNISRRSYLNNRSSREIQMVITFHREIRLRRIIYRDVRTWTTKALEKFKWS